MKNLFNLVFWVVVIAWWYVYWQYSQFESEIITEESEIYSVVPNATYRSLLLERWTSEFFTKLYLRNNAPEKSLQVWSYEIPAWADVKTFLSSFETAVNNDVQLTFLEGWNIYDIDLKLSEDGFINSWEFVTYVTECVSFCALKTDFAFISDAEMLEWFLYPDTYAINPNSFTTEDLVRKMLTRFQQKVIDSGIITNMGSIEILDIITMASIVQKEANKADNPEEIAIIAWILKKRVDEGWQIGADATVCYAFEVATQNCTPTKVLEYLYDDNKYNTRVIVGMPMGPISNPEAEVIEATLNSKSSPYYFYLHDNSWQIHYGETNADHENNKNQYLR